MCRKSLISLYMSCPSSANPFLHTIRSGACSPDQKDKSLRHRDRVLALPIPTLASRTCSHTYSPLFSVQPSRAPIRAPSGRVRCLAPGTGRGVGEKCLQHDEQRITIVAATCTCSLRKKAHCRGSSMSLSATAHGLLFILPEVSQVL
jgi:hypothetical protein